MGLIKSIRTSAQRKTNVLYDTYFTRQLSVFFTAALAPLNIHPNAVSVINIIVGLAGCVFIAGANAPWVYIGVGFIHLYAILDSVDGELARYLRKSSVNGVFLENYSAYTQINGFNIAVGVYLLNTINLLWPLLAALGLAAFGRNAMPCARRTILTVLKNGGDISFTEEANTQYKKGLISRIISFVNDHAIYQTNMWAVLSVLVLVESIWEPNLKIVLYGFCFYTAGQVFKEVGIVILASCTNFIKHEVGSVVNKYAGN